MTRARRRHEAQLLADLDRAIRPRRPGGQLGLPWRWRYEIALLAGAAAMLIALVRVVGTEWAIVTVSALTGALGPWPPSHRAFLAHAWRIITPHRLRTGFAEARIQSLDGRLPFVLRTTRQPFGERVQVWCPAGVSAEDFRSARAILRAACWAADVRVRADDRHAQRVTIDVIRRLSFLALPERGPQRGVLGLQRPHPCLQFQHPPDPRQGHAVGGEFAHVLDHGDLAAGVPPLAAVGARGTDHPELVETAQESLPDLEHG